MESLVKFKDIDLIPSGRLSCTGDHLQIGDCLFRIPPTSIKVKQVADIQTAQGMRQRNTIITKSGRSQTEITIDLWLSGIEDINGRPVEGPGGKTYYVDGLRPLIAQFKRTPILPVFNDLLNFTYNIYTVLLASIVVETVPDFPNALLVHLTLYQTTVQPYILMPDFVFPDMICWPVFRWYYQRLLSGEAAEYLEPIKTNNLTEEYGFAIIDAVALAKGEKVDQEGTAAKSVIEIKDGFELVGGDAYGNKATGPIERDIKGVIAIMPAGTLAGKLGLDWKWKNSKVVIGGKEFKPYRVVKNTPWVRVENVAAQFNFIYQPETRGKVANKSNTTIKLIPPGGAGNSLGDLNNCLTDYASIEGLHLAHLSIGLGNVFTNLYIQSYTDPCHQFLGSMERHIVATFVAESPQAVAELKALVDAANAMTISFHKRVVSGFVGFKNELAALFGIRYVVISSVEESTVEGMPGMFNVTVSMIEFDRLQKSYERSRAISGLRNNDIARSISSVDTENLTEIEQALFFDEALNTFDLYPDLDLPTYRELKDAVNSINTFLTKKGMSRMKYTPARPFGAPESDDIYVDPDFYIDYSFAKLDQ